jgi:MFS family permease
VLAVAQVLATLAGGWLVNRFGRKRMLVAGGYVATAALFSIFIVYTLSPKSIMLLVALIVAFILAFAATVGIVPVLYLGELLPNLACINHVFWTFSLVGTLSSELMLTQIGVAKSFFIYAVVCFLCTFILSS